MLGVALVLISLLHGAHAADAATMSVTFSPATVPGGSSATGRVTIREAAPDGGLTVSLTGQASWRGQGRFGRLKGMEVSARVQSPRRYANGAVRFDTVAAEG